MQPTYIDEARSITERQMRAQNFERQEHNRKCVLGLLTVSWGSDYAEPAWWPLGPADSLGLCDFEYDVAQYLVEKLCWSHQDWAWACGILDYHRGQLYRLWGLVHQPPLTMQVSETTIRLHAIALERRAKAA